MTVEYRCKNLMHGKRLEGDLLEVKCRRRQCGVRPGVVVLHTFNITTGELVRTRSFNDPAKRKDLGDAPHDAPIAVRTP